MRNFWVTTLTSVSEVLVGAFLLLLGGVPTHDKLGKAQEEIIACDAH